MRTGPYWSPCSRSVKASGTFLTCLFLEALSSHPADHGISWRKGPLCPLTSFVCIAGAEYDS